MNEENASPKEGIDQSQEEAVLTPAETEALNSGWVPKDQFHGDEHKWVEAGEYLRRGELFKKIDHTTRELKDVKRALNEMGKLHAGVREVEYQRALDTLRQQKKNALEEGDADAVIAADDRIALVRDQQKQQQAAPEFQDAPQEHPDFAEWKSENSWYTKDQELQGIADTLGNRLSQEGLTPNQVLKRVAAAIKRDYPNKFSNPNQNRPNSVEGVRGGGKSSSTFVLSGDERRIMTTLVKQGVMTEADYIKDLKSVRGN